MSASTMTFVLFFQDAFVAGWASERTRAVADKHPSRVIIFDGTQGAERSYSQPPSHRGEWVEIGVKGSDPHEMGAALTMLELPEAPVVLNWIAGDFANDARFALLAKMAGTVIVSSSVIKTDGTGLHDLTSFIERFPEIAVQDVSYLRLAAWQELVAEFFDDDAAFLELEAVREVEVMAGSDPEMYYLLGWLASRLAWTPVGNGGFTNSNGATIKFTMTHDGPPRRLSRVSLKTAESSYTAEVHPADDSAICLRVEGAHARDERCSPMHSVDIASLVERAILTTGRDEVFIESLAMAKHIMERQTS
jgi:glucose-6-phosphate dehydrogenase assembly protein OpcA